jgi:hypothetical protein
LQNHPEIESDLLTPGKKKDQYTIPGRRDNKKGLMRNWQNHKLTALHSGKAQALAHDIVSPAVQIIHSIHLQYNLKPLLQILPGYRQLVFLQRSFPGFGQAVEQVSTRHHLRHLRINVILKI